MLLLPFEGSPTKDIEISSGGSLYLPAFVSSCSRRSRKQVLNIVIRVAVPNLHKHDTCVIITTDVKMRIAWRIEIGYCSLTCSIYSPSYGEWKECPADTHSPRCPVA